MAERVGFRPRDITTPQGAAVARLALLSLEGYLEQVTWASRPLCHAL